MNKNRCPRKLKKKIIRECGRESYKLWLSHPNYLFRRKVYCRLGNKGWQTIDTGKYHLMFNIEEYGERNKR
jgi:hypothetical protein